MDDIIVVKLTKGAELVGRHVSNPLNSKVVLDDALNVLMQPTEDGRVQIGLAPITLSIAPRKVRPATASNSGLRRHFDLWPTGIGCRGCLPSGDLEDRGCALGTE